jgi:hypothetical protein
MTKLNGNWLTEGMLDFEYKKYILQAYFKSVLNQFEEHRLYPYLPELQMHYTNTVQFMQSKGAFKSSFPKTMTGIDWKNLSFRYQETSSENSYLEEVNNIIDFAIPRFSSVLAEGEQRLKGIENKLSFSSVGIIPLRKEEGYLFIHRISKHETCIFRYQLALYNSNLERQVQTEWVDSVKKGIGTTFENIKLELARKYESMPNPATYIVESAYDYPLEETLLPVAKRLMVKAMNVA